MKKTNKYSILVVVATMLCCSCSDFLDIEPKDRITGDVLLSTDGGINSYMATHYYNLPIEDFRFDFTKDNTDGFNIGRCDGGKTNNDVRPRGCAFGVGGTSSERRTDIRTGIYFINIFVVSMS